MSSQPGRPDRAYILSPESVGDSDNPCCSVVKSRKARVTKYDRDRAAKLAKAGLPPQAQPFSRYHNLKMVTERLHEAENIHIEKQIDKNIPLAAIRYPGRNPPPSPTVTIAPPHTEIPMSDSQFIFPLSGFSLSESPPSESSPSAPSSQPHSTIRRPHFQKNRISRKAAYKSPETVESDEEDEDAPPQSQPESEDEYADMPSAQRVSPLPEISNSWWAQDSLPPTPPDSQVEPLSAMFESQEDEGKAALSQEQSSIQSQPRIRDSTASPSPGGKRTTTRRRRNEYDTGGSLVTRTPESSQESQSKPWLQQTSSFHSSPDSTRPEMHGPSSQTKDGRKLRTKRKYPVPQEYTPNGANRFQNEKRGTRSKKELERREKEWEWVRREKEWVQREKEEEEEVVERQRQLAAGLEWTAASDVSASVLGDQVVKNADDWDEGTSSGTESVCSESGTDDGDVSGSDSDGSQYDPDCFVIGRLRVKHPDLNWGAWLQGKSRVIKLEPVADDVITIKDSDSVFDAVMHYENGQISDYDEEETDDLNDMGPVRKPLPISANGVQVKQTTTRKRPCEDELETRGQSPRERCSRAAGPTARRNPQISREVTPQHGEECDITNSVVEVTERKSPTKPRPFPELAAADTPLRRHSPPPARPKNFESQNDLRARNDRRKARDKAYIATRVQKGFVRRFKVGSR